MAIELEALESTVHELVALYADAAAREPMVREKTAAAAFLAQFSTGIENVLKRISRSHNVPLPTGDTWRTRSGSDAFVSRRTPTPSLVRCVPGGCAGTVSPLPIHRKSQWAEPEAGTRPGRAGLVVSPVCPTRYDPGTARSRGASGAAQVVGVCSARAALGVAESARHAVMPCQSSGDRAGDPGIGHGRGRAQAVPGTFYLSTPCNAGGFLVRSAHGNDTL